MKLNKYHVIGFFGLSMMCAACTKLEETLHDSVLVNPASNTATPASLLTAGYNDLNSLFHNQDQVFALQEVTSDEALVPTRGGDWDDNGVWRVLHAHKWDGTHAYAQTVFNALGKLETDATTALAFNPSATEAAEANFLRSLAQFYYLDLYGQVPYRTIADYNGLGPAPVMTPKQAIDTLVKTLNAIIPQLPQGNRPYRANPDAARFLLMKVLLNKGAYLNRAAPTFDAGDMAQVISLGQAIMNSGNYSFTPNYFDNFGPLNSSTSKEMIFAYPNNGTTNNNGIGNGGLAARWMMTLHYNSWNKTAPNAGWNGFSTVADFYNAFESADSRLGGKFYPGVTDTSGLKPGFLVGQQFDQNGVAEKDRKGNPLAFTPEVHLVEADKNKLETAGIRVIKYPPDYLSYGGGSIRNQLIFFRYADVALMIAEAQLRTNDAASGLATVNSLRSARGASSLSSLTADNLLAERGRELYWESWRRQDLIRFGVYLKPWALKTDDDPKYFLFPVPAAQLVANPNLKQNPGY